MLQILSPVVTVFVLSFLANRFLVGWIPANLYLCLLFPGVVIHELSHGAFSILTGTPVHGIQLFSRTGGHVVHGQPRIPVVGQLIISFAPLVVGLALATYLVGILPLETDSQWAITIYKYHVALPRVASDWQIIDFIWLYLLLSIVLTLTPSKQDISASSAGVIVFIIVLYILKLNGWLYVPVEAIAFLWYINICLAIIVLAAFAGKRILGYKGG